MKCPKADELDYDARRTEHRSLSIPLCSTSYEILVIQILFINLLSDPYIEHQIFIKCRRVFVTIILISV